MAATGFFGLLKSEDEGDDEKVPPSVKRQLLKAQRALRNEDYGGAERAYHNALKLLATSEHASTQPYIEARAVTLDKVSGWSLDCHGNSIEVPHVCMSIIGASLSEPHIDEFAVTTCTV